MSKARNIADIGSDDVLATTATGIDVTGDITPTGGVYLGGTGAANKLDDYETGTWTPTITYSSVAPDSVTYITRAGSYTKTGNTITVHCSIRLSAFTKGSGSGILQITGLPFSGASGADFTGAVSLYNSTFTSQPVALAGNGVAYISMLRLVSNGGWVSLDDPDSNAQYFVSLTYKV